MLFLHLHLCTPMYLKHKQATRHITAPQLEKRKWPLTWKSAVERSSRLEKSNSDTQTRSPKPEFIDASADDLAAVCIHRTITFHYFITVWSMFLKCNNFVTAVLISTIFCLFNLCQSVLIGYSGCWWSSVTCDTNWATSCRRSHFPKHMHWDSRCTQQDTTFQPAIELLFTP